jgi:hypothetical protein
MEHSRRRTAAVALLVCVPTLLLAALPALGLRMDDLRPAADESGRRAHAVDEVWVGRVSISGTVRTQLSPGVVSPISVTFHNSNPQDVTMRRLRVRIARVSAPQADAAHPCTRADFQVKQLRKRKLVIPAGRATDLTGLRISLNRWPTLAMLNRPVNQDGCKGASITLRFRTHRVGTHPGTGR